MEIKIRERKRKFTAFVIAVMVVVCNTMPIFASTYSVYDLTDGNETGKIDSVKPGDVVKLYGPHISDFGSYSVGYYSPDDHFYPVVTDESMTAESQDENGKYYFEGRIKNYSEVFTDDIEGARKFKEWKIERIYKSAGSASNISLQPSFYNEADIIYHIQGNATNAADNPSTYCEGKEEIVLNDAIAAEGYIFDGWYDSEAYTNKVESISVTQTGEVNLYAKISKADYQIVYELNGGTNSENNPSAYTYGTGVTGFEPALKSGYTFDGWYLDAAYTNKVEYISDTSVGTVTLYAKFTVIEQAGQPEEDTSPEEPDNSDKPLGESETLAFLIGVLFVAGLGIFTFTYISKKQNKNA